MVEYHPVCFACEAFSGRFGDSFDYLEELSEDYPELKIEGTNPASTAVAWLAHFQRALPHMFDADYLPPEGDDIDEFTEDYYLLDLVVSLLHEAKHPLFSSPPVWMPAELLCTAKKLAFAEAKQTGQSTCRGLVYRLLHDCLAPKEEWFIKEGEYKREMKQLAGTSKDMCLMVEQVFKPHLPDAENHKDILASLHTCK